MSKKQIALSFLNLAQEGDYRRAFEKHVSAKFVHHNQFFKGDRDSLLAAMEESHKTSPNKTVQVKQIYEDGDTVVTYSKVDRQDPGALPIAVVHIFRIENDKIVELWDLGQEMMKDSPNEHGMF